MHKKEETFYIMFGNFHYRAYLRIELTDETIASDNNIHWYAMEIFSMALYS